jgi:hypothetical protein
VDLYNKGNDKVKNSPSLRQINTLSESIKKSIANSIRVGPKKQSTPASTTKKSIFQKKVAQKCTLCMKVMEPKSKVQYFYA